MLSIRNKTFILSLVMLNVVMLSAVVLNVGMLSVVVRHCVDGINQLPDSVVRWLRGSFETFIQ
jgi:hypothetical protein